MPVTQSTTAEGRLHPTLVVHAFFRVATPEDMLRTQFRRREHPDIDVLDVGGTARALMLGPGDGALYAGTRTPHWRDALPPGQRATAAFFFVPPAFKGTFN